VTSDNFPYNIGYRRAERAMLNCSKFNISRTGSCVLMKFGTIVSSTNLNIPTKFHRNILTGSETAKVESFTVTTDGGARSKRPMGPWWAIDHSSGTERWVAMKLGTIVNTSDGNIPTNLHRNRPDSFRMPTDIRQTHNTTFRAQFS
jgi:hypothetical protein